DGPTRDADLSRAVLRRPGEDQPIAIDMDQLWNHGELSLNLRLVQGDVLVVPKNTSNLVYLLGGVTRPDPYPIRPRDPILDILVPGGSPTQDANLAKVTLTRTLPGGGTTTMKLDLKKLKKGGDITVAQSPVEPGDVIVVPTSKPKETGQQRIQTITSLISLLVSLSTLSQITNNNRNNRGGGTGSGVGR